MNLTKTLVPFFYLWVHFWIFHFKRRVGVAVQPRNTIVRPTGISLNMTIRLKTNRYRKLWKNPEINAKMKVSWISTLAVHKGV